MAGLVQHPGPSAATIPHSSASGMNSSGGTVAQLGVVPAQQRLGADRPPAGSATTGWNASRSSSRSIAPRSSCSTVVRRRSQLVVRGVVAARPGSCHAAWRSAAPGRRCAAAAPRAGSSAPVGHPDARRQEDRPRRPVVRLGRAPPSSRSATAAASSGRPCISTANSSPPSRAATSPGRRLPRSRRPTSTSTASPTSWPRMSLTFLKPSRSRASSTHGLPVGGVAVQRPQQRRAGWPGRSADRCAPAHGSAPPARPAGSAYPRTSRRVRYCRADQGEALHAAGHDARRGRTGRPGRGGTSPTAGHRRASGRSRTRRRCRPGPGRSAPARSARYTASATISRPAASTAAPVSATVGPAWQSPAAETQPAAGRTALMPAPSAASRRRVARRPGQTTIDDEPGTERRRSRWPAGSPGRPIGVAAPSNRVGSEKSTHPTNHSAAAMTNPSRASRAVPAAVAATRRAAGADQRRRPARSPPCRSPRLSPNRCAARCSWAQWSFALSAATTPATRLSTATPAAGREQHVCRPTRHRRAAGPTTVSSTVADRGDEPAERRDSDHARWKMHASKSAGWAHVMGG